MYAEVTLPSSSFEVSFGVFGFVDSVGAGEAVLAESRPLRLLCVRATNGDHKRHIGLQRERLVEDEMFAVKVGVENSDRHNITDTATVGAGQVGNSYSPVRLCYSVDHLAGTHLADDLIQIGQATAVRDEPAPVNVALSQNTENFMNVFVGPALTAF